MVSLKKTFSLRKLLWRLEPNILSAYHFICDTYWQSLWHRTQAEFWHQVDSLDKEHQFERQDPVTQCRVQNLQKQSSFSDFVTPCLHVSLKVFKSNLLCTPCDFSPFEWTPIDFAGKVCEAEMTYDRVSISFLHIQPQLISSHSLDLSQIKQPSLWLCVCVWSGKGWRWWSNILASFWWHLILEPCFICQSTE